MSDFEILLLKQALPIYVGISLITTLILARLTANLRPRILMTALFIFAAVFINVVVAAAVLVSLAIVSMGRDTMAAGIAAGPTAMISYFLELGIEFSVVTFPITIAFFVWIQFRRSVRNAQASAFLRR